MKRWIIGVVVLLAVGGVVFANLKREAGDTMKVQAEPAARRDLVSEVSASGRIQPKREVKVSATRMGRITRIGVEEGDRVHTGDFLLEIDPTPYTSSVKQLRASVEAARADLRLFEAEASQAKQEEERIERLKANGLASERETEQAATAASVARARVASARENVRRSEALLENARHELSEVTIEAEMDGVITQLNVEEGETAIVGTMNIAGTELLRIADLSVMEAEVKVDETEVVEIRLKQSAEITIDSYPDTTFSGIVTEIGNSPILPQGGIRDQSVDFKVVVTLTDSVPGVRPGLSAKAKITVAERDSVVSVPIQSLTVRRRSDLDDDGGNDRRSSPEAIASELADEDEDEEIEGVFVIENRRAWFRPVSSGISGDKHFEIVEGLEAGEIVVSGDFKAIRELRNGQKTKIEKKKKREKR